MEIALEFRAGKMTFDGKKVVPDPRKGLVRIGRDDEGLVHFQWMERTHNVMEDELQDQIVFPDEAVFEKVNQSSGRIYILKFNSDGRKFFFWMQEPKAEDDQQLCNSVNYHINQPLEFPEEGERDVTVPLQISEDVVEEEISLRAGNMVGPTMGTESEITSLSGAVKLEDLQRILNNMGTAAAAEDPDGRLGLGDILRPDLILPLLDMLSLDECLTSFLPEGQCSTQEFMELLQSPPFRQQVDSFTYVLRTGQIDLTQFGIDPSKYKFTVTSFLEALEDSVLNASETAAGQDDDLSVRSQSFSDPMDESK